MLSRVAENIYWLSRYLERAANTVRLVNNHSYMLLEMPDVDEHLCWMPLIIINGQAEAFSEIHKHAEEQAVNFFLLADNDNAGSLIKSFKAIQYNLRTCRDIVPRDSYEAINSLCRFYIDQADQSLTDTSSRSAFLQNTENRLLTIFGGINSNMSHDLAYRFMQMGCYLERADMTSRIIDVQSIPLIANNTQKQGIPVQQQRWVAVLKSLSAFQMYRQHVRRPVNGKDTLAYLLLDQELPRSYSFCLNHLAECLDHLQNHQPAKDAIHTLQQQLKNADLDDLAYNPVLLHEYLDSLQLGMLEVGSAIAQSYFPPPQAC